MTRLSVSMLSLSVLVAVAQEHGYAHAGLAMTVYAVTSAVASPLRGRLADRRRARTVLLALLAVHAPAFALLPLTLTAPFPLLLTACFLVGISVPPTGPVVRGQWPRMYAANQLSTAYAFDSALNNATFVAGPAIAGTLLVALPAPAVIVVTAAVKVTGDLIVATAPSLTTHQPSTSGGWPLRHARVRLVLVAIAADTCAFGALEVAAVAAAGGKGSAGLLTGALAVGAVVGGLVYGTRTWPDWLLPALTAAGVAVLAVGATLSGLALLTVVYGLFGLANGPVETLKFELLGAATPTAERVEAFAWVFTFAWLGIGIGTAVAGALAGAVVVAVVAQVIALALTVPLRKVVGDA